MRTQTDWKEPEMFNQLIREVDIRQFKSLAIIRRIQMVILYLVGMYFTLGVISYRVSIL